MLITRQINPNCPATGYPLKKPTKATLGSSRSAPGRTRCRPLWGGPAPGRSQGRPAQRWRRPAQRWRLAAPCGSAGTRWGGGGWAGQGGGAGGTGLSRVVSPRRWSGCCAPTMSITVSPARRWRGTRRPAGSAGWDTPPRRRWERAWGSGARGWRCCPGRAGCGGPGPWPNALVPQAEMYDSSFFYENLKVPTVAMGERQRGQRLMGRHTRLGLRRDPPGRCRGCRAGGTSWRGTEMWDWRSRGPHGSTTALPWQL